jgi:2',3'-cyclic-nucleotide 2'-phosphodiesterase (5'-nucleotidase family)
LKKLLVFFLLVVQARVLFAQTTEVIFIQMNDVYEIAPLDGGKDGGLARVATIINQYRTKNPYTYVFLSGDFISPSAIGTSEYEGKRINGRQMVDVLNFIGLDYVTFGNHEFDYKYEVLQERIDQSKFEWINSNVYRVIDGKEYSFSKLNQALPEYKILKIPGYIKNREIKIGMLGVCIDANKQPYVFYENYIDASKRVYGQIKDSIDYLIGITHLDIDMDKKLAAELPQLKLIMGGHEHVNMFHKVGSTIITKADANAATVYVHKLIFDEHNKLIEIKSDLIDIDSTIIEDPKTKELVDEWTFRAFKGFMDKGFDPMRMVYDLEEPLDGREQTVRYQLCPLGVLICMSMLNAAKGSDCAIINSGAIRIDDELKGEITQYDIIRVLPFGGKILQVETKGSLLKQIMDTGVKNEGNGGYLQYYGIESTVNGWKVKGEPVNDEKIYNVAINDYLMSGLEQNLGFLTKDNPAIIKVTGPEPSDKNDLRNDIRFAVVDYFKKWNQNK